MKQRVVIIGAGYGGLALANMLAKVGYAVTVCEKNAHAGGRVQAVERDGFIFDLGPSWYLMPEVFEEYYRLFDESAAKQLELKRFSPAYKVWFENQPAVEIAGDIERDAATFEAIEPGAGAALKEYVARSTRTYKLALNHFLYTNFRRGRDLLRPVIIRSAPKMINLSFTSLDSYVSRHFHDQRLKQLLEYQMVFLGSSPYKAPALYSLMSHLDFSSGVFYPKRGMQALVEDMIRIGTQLGVKYKYETEIVQIKTSHGAATGVKLVDGSLLEADLVVSNADLAWTETQLLAEPDRTYPEAYWQNRQPGPSALLVSLGIAGRLEALRHHNLFFVDNWRENFRSIYETGDIPVDTSVYVCNPSKTDSTLAPSDHENVFVLMPLPPRRKLSDTEQTDLVERSIDIVQQMSGATDLRERIVSQVVFGPDEFDQTFHAWGNNAFGGESHILRQSALFRTRNVSRKVSNLYYVGAGTLPGIGLPMCLISAHLAYKQIIGDTSSGPVKELVA